MRFRQVNISYIILTTVKSRVGVTVAQHYQYRTVQNYCHTIICTGHSSLINYSPDDSIIKLTKQKPLINTEF